MFFEIESGFFFFWDAFLRFVLSSVPSRLDLQAGLRRRSAVVIIVLLLTLRG